MRQRQRLRTRAAAARAARRLRDAADLAAVLEWARPARWFRRGRVVRAHDRMQRYEYRLAAAPGRGFARGFRPELTPAQMLAAGVFEGRYLNDCALELPREWLARALRRGRLRPGGPADPAANLFGVKSRLSLREWRRRRWLHAPDPRGWFQWYCRYWLGRREPALDALQIRRWRQFARHRAQILASYRHLGAARPRTRAEKARHRARQRQALLQWAYDPFI